MATSSFDKSFVVRDKSTADKFCSDFNKSHPVKVERRDSTKDKKEGISLLKQFRSA